MEEINFDKVMEAQAHFREKLEEMKESTKRLGERISEMETILNHGGSSAFQRKARRDEGVYKTTW
nr:MAG TPA: ESAT-6-like protein [Caudoviricetes sp.]